MLEACQRATGLTPNKARALLGRFLFSGEEAEKPLDGLSGGERRRLSLAILVHSGANVLILDEPTNHLDLESREALEDALQRVPRARCCSSPTTARCSTRSGRARSRSRTGTLHSYVGGWAEYVRVREGRGRCAPSREARNGGAENGPRAPSSPKPPGGPLSKNAARAEPLEREIEAAETELSRWRTSSAIRRPGRRRRPRAVDEAPRRGQARARAALCRAGEAGARRPARPLHRVSLQRGTLVPCNEIRRSMIGSG